MKQEKSGKQFQSHISNQQNQVSQSSELSQICSICGASDHVATNGANGSKLIQYFCCKIFVEMTPANRFSELIKKYLCFQCLFPSATRSQGNHKEGRCQRDFVCPHKSHDEYPTKKHILVCDEHKQHPQNQELLKQYKDKFITRQKSVMMP